MDPVQVEYSAHSVETEVLALWRARHLPPPGGVLGPASGPTVRQFEGSWTQGDYPSQVAQRAVAADIDARYLGLVGRRAVGTLRQGTGPSPSPPTAVPALLTSLGVWVGGDGRAPWDSVDRFAGVQAIVGRLAEKGILVTRDESLRVCPSCAAPRSPERVLYDEQEGDTVLVRFPVRVGNATVNALVWVDTPWKLLGTSALLVNPNLRYVVVRYRRREDQELVLTSRSALHRIGTWIPEAELEVVEERLGRELQGTPYTYPLRHEFPMGGDLTAPAGTIVTATEVGDSGTGIVPLVPGHGPTDSQVADRLGVEGWPLVTPKGKLDFTLMHKYAGLDLDTASEFVLRDLAEAGALFAHLTVKRGVPHCTLCGTPLLWASGRAWCLEPSRLPSERKEMFTRLLPGEALPGPGEVAFWPVCEATPNEDASSVGLLECVRCDRLAPPESSPQCPCGGQRSLVHRRLLPSTGAVFTAWARFDPFPDGDSVHLYVSYRRRVPSVINHLAALTGVQGSVGDLSLSVLPTVAEADVTELIEAHGADAVRAALVRGEVSDAAAGPLADRSCQEAERIRRLWTIAREVVSMCDPAMLSTLSRPIGESLGELETEDRAILARWERTRVLVLAHYENGAPNLVYRRSFQFLDNDLVEYRKLAQPRLALSGHSTTKRAALRTLSHLLRGLSEVLGPILPFTSESIHRALSSDRTSLFERPVAGLDRSLLNDDLNAAWDRWRTVLRSLDGLRRSLGVPPATVLPSVVLILAADDLADRFRGEREVLGRLARVQRIEVGSPKEPWTGRQRTIRPIESEIQRAYPTQASQIVHVLQRMPPRRWEAALGQEEITVVINGLPRRVFPSMVALADTLPERVAPVPWSLGEMYAELPAGVSSVRPTPPPLSVDTFWLVRRLDARLRAVPPAEGHPPRVALVTAKDPLASELRAAAEPIARYLGLGELRVVAKTEETVPPNAISGRTHTGDRWWVHVPELPVRPPREKHRRLRARVPRVSVDASQVARGSGEVDYAEEKVVAHAEEVRSLGQELDGLLGVPLLGPSKIAAAWERGIHSVEDLRVSSFDTILSLPGFGGPIAEVVVERLGGTVPEGGFRRAAASRAAPESAGHEAQVAGGSPVTVASESRPTPMAVTPSSPPTPPEVLPMASTPDTTNLILPRHEEPEGVQRPIAKVISSAPEAPFPQAAGSLETTVETPTVSGSTPSSEGLSGPVSPASTEPEGTAVERAPEVGGANPELSTASPAEGPASVEETFEHEPVTVARPERPEASPLPEATAVGEGTRLAEETNPSLGEGPAPEGETPVPTGSTGPAGDYEQSAAPALETIPETPRPETPVEAATEPSLTHVADLVTVEAGPSVPAQEPPIGTEMPPEETEEPVSNATSEQATLPAAEPDRAPSAEPVPSPPEPHDLRASRPPAMMPSEVPEPAANLSSSVPPGESTPEANAQPMDTASAELVEPPEVAAVPTDEVPSPQSPPLELAAPTPSENLQTEVRPAPETVQPPPPLEPVSHPEELASPSPRETVSPPVPGTATVAPPAIPPAEPLPALPPSGVELTIGDSFVVALNGFLESTAAGHHGVCVVRESPERIRARVGSRPIDVFWLTNIGRGPALRPSDLDGVWAFLGRKVVDERVTAFFLEGIEYLVRLHGADAVLTGLVEFDHLARENGARIWVCLTPALMKPGDLERFRGTFGAASG